MTVGLTLAALGGFPIRNVVVQFALTVANDDVLTANLGLLDVVCKCHDNRGVHFVFLSVCRCEPSRGLALCQLGVIGRDAL